MSIEINRITFRRLVQLYLLSIVLLIVAAVYEGLSPAYAAFSAEFDDLVARHFGELKNSQLSLVITAAGVSVLMHFVATFGLLRFKRWARWLFWASMLLALPFGLIPGFEVYWTGYWTGWTTTLGSALFGMVLLLAYSREHGALWFAGDAATMKD